MSSMPGPLHDFEIPQKTPLAPRTGPDVRFSPLLYVDLWLHRDGCCSVALYA